MLVLVLYSYLLGGVWEIGPFADKASCESARRFQITHGIADVTECRICVRPLGPRTTGIEDDDP